MAESSSPDPIPPSNIQPTKSVQPSDDGQLSTGDKFKSLMEGGDRQPVGSKLSASEEISPLNLASREATPFQSVPSMDSVMGQINSTSSILGDLQNQLHTKNLTLKQSQKYLLRNKLTSAHEHIRSAADKMGVSLSDPPLSSTRQSPIAKFLGLITDGQNQLNKTEETIQNMKLSNGSLSPSKLLTIQIKLAKAQQELEYSSVLLSKAVDDIKTMFNIQL